MADIETRFYRRLEEEAAAWVEEELTRRMVHARQAIEEQVNTALPEVGPARAANHLREAVAFAEENIRMDLELEAQAWIEEEKGKRAGRKGSMP